MKLTISQQAKVLELINDEVAQEEKTYLDGVIRTLRLFGVRIPN